MTGAVSRVNRPAAKLGCNWPKSALNHTQSTKGECSTVNGECSTVNCQGQATINQTPSSETRVSLSSIGSPKDFSASEYPQHRFLWGEPLC